ncbi:winged helix-turn-helix domain-containing protein [Iamia majanohamensis]|uniref:Winged helix-turn-helix domain-containing protein n=1 Tax=Iamia majanohamensis TaxID=467976 RepID=A0AAE9Y537_9ACTN|nr:winged helix-turn-helix domain-containing protein [Iamia majanohamensis]WCO66589.1 winged helix-turn-helix domain-containing protein [Iamia majanohamensis]
MAPSRPGAEDAAGRAAGEVFAALADPTRRAVLRAVADRGQATATDLGAAVGVSRQAAAKHLDLLAAAGLVADRHRGRERLWQVTPAPLAEAADWLAAAGAAWDRRLARLADVADPERSP